MSSFNARGRSFAGGIDSIEVAYAGGDAIIWHLPYPFLSIEHDTKLIVHEKHIAVMIREGRITDIYPTGEHLLKVSPKHHDAQLYFISTAQSIERTWQTFSPVLVKDPEFGQVKVGLMGQYSARLRHDPIPFVKYVTADGIALDNLTALNACDLFATAQCSKYLLQSQISILDLSTSLSAFSKEVTIALRDVYAAHGLELNSLDISDITLPQNVRETLHSYCGNEDEAISHVPPPRVYYTAHESVTSGPFSHQEMNKMIRSARVRPETLVWTQGMSHWEKAGQLPELSILFPSTPPPLNT